MMSRAPRWPESPLDYKSNKSTQKTGAKERAASAAPVSRGSKQANVRYGRSHSLNRKGSDATASASQAGGSLKRSISHQVNAGNQDGRQTSCPARSAISLCSSRSFSSLHTSTLSAAPFMRSSRSLSRLDQRSTGDDSDAVPCSRVKMGQLTENTALSSGQLSSSGEQIRDNKEQYENSVKIKTSCSSKSSPSSVSTAECPPYCNKVKKQTRDGVYTLCAKTSVMRRNFIQAVLKNVRPSLSTDTTSSLSDQMTHQKTQLPDPHAAEGPEKVEHPNGFLQEQKPSDRSEETHHQLSEGEQSLADGSSTSPVITSSSIPPQQVEEGEAVSCGVSSCAEGAESKILTSTIKLSNEQSDMQRNTEEEVKTTTQSEEQVSFNMSCEGTKEGGKLLCEQQTMQLVKELEQTQKELSQLQQSNQNLQDELRQERESHLLERVHPQDQSLAVQRLQKMNHDLRFELETLKRSQEEAREAELRRRVDLLAQQAQLLVTGDATALAQAQMEQERREFLELQAEWEHCTASLQSQLNISEEQKKEAQLRFTQLQQELESFHSLHQETKGLQKQLEEVTIQLRCNEEAQAQKDAHLEKHLMLLQASQDRERRNLTASLAQADQHSKDLQERLDRTGQQVENLNKTETWAREIEKAQQQLEEELACTISTVQKLQEEREQLEHQCEELQNQLSEAEGEASQLQSRLETNETHYCNLEQSYTKVCEELQAALGKVQQKESETKEIQEDYERLLDRKEQELREVLLKMEVLGNSLEEAEVKLNELLNGGTRISSLLKDQSAEPGQQNERLNDNILNVGERARSCSSSSDWTYQVFESAGDDPDRFMSVIQILETKLFVTEEKLRDIMQRLEEHQSHITCQDPQLCSQLTQSRATAQHLSLLLHRQAKQSQRFAQETESCCRVLVGRFQVALKIVQTCRKTLKLGQIDSAVLEKQMATIVACLQQGEKDAERHKQESCDISKAGDKILNESNFGGKSTLTNVIPLNNEMESVEKYLKNEVFVIEQIVSALKSQHGSGEVFLTAKENEEGVAQRYRSIITQRIALMTENKKAEFDNTFGLNVAISRVCAEAELIYAALKLQQQYDSLTHEVNHQRKGLADISPPELASYEQQVEDNIEEGAAKPVGKDDSDVEQVDADKDPDCLERLLARLQRRAKCLRHLIQETSDMDDIWENASGPDLNWILEEARLIYLLERLCVAREGQQREVSPDKQQTLCKDRDITLKNEPGAFNHTPCQLQEDNSILKELKCAEQKIISVQTGNQSLLEDIQKINEFHEKQVNKLQTVFQEKIGERQDIHEEKIKHTHGYCTGRTSGVPDNTGMDRKTEKPGTQIVGGDAAAMADCHQKNVEKHEASSTISAMEEKHRKLNTDLLQQHEQKVRAPPQNKDQQLQEETVATLTATVALRRAHKLEPEKSQQAQHNGECADVTHLHAEHESEIQLLQKELEMLSVQHTQKCLENSQLNQELQGQKQTFIQHQKENQELKKKQREEISQVHFMANGKQSHMAAQMNDFYETEVIQRAREAEAQFFRQEARSLKEELKLARMDKIYAQNKLKALYMKSQHEPCHNVSNLRQEFKYGTWSPNRGGSAQTHSTEDTAANPSNAAFMKKTEKPSLLHQLRGERSKSLKDGLSAQERMKLFESF